MDMNMKNDKELSSDIEALAQVLDDGGDGESVSLDGDQIGILRKVLARMASDQMLIVSLQRRLKRYTEAGGEIEAEVGRIFGKIRAHAAGGGVDGGYDYEGAKAAREAFVREIEEAARSKDIVVATLGLAARLGAIL